MARIKRTRFCGIIYTSLEELNSKAALKERLDRFAQDYIWATMYEDPSAALRLLGYIFEFAQNNIPLDPILKSYLFDCTKEMESNAALKGDVECFLQEFHLRTKRGNKFKLKEKYEYFLPAFSKMAEKPRSNQGRVWPFSTGLTTIQEVDMMVGLSKFINSSSEDMTEAEKEILDEISIDPALFLKGFRTYYESKAKFEESVKNLKSAFEVWKDS